MEQKKGKVVDLGSDLADVPDEPTENIQKSPKDVLSGDEIMQLNLPEQESYWGEFLYANDRMGIIAREKCAKSFFAMQLGISISSGSDFLGYKTERSNVLYINFEISIERLRERIEDLLTELSLPVTNFFSKTVPEGISMDTDSGKKELKAILENCKDSGHAITVLIIDPRRQSMSGDENQSEVLNRWCLNLNSLQDEFKFALVIVHHQGKRTTGAGRGSSVFDAWLTTILTIEPKKNRDLSWVTINIFGRNFDATEMQARFKYPKWQVSKQDLTNRESAVDKAKTAILNYLTVNKRVLQVDLRNLLYKQGISPYAFNEAKKQLGDSIVIETAQGIRGNQKIIRLKNI